MYHDASIYANEKNIPFFGQLLEASLRKSESKFTFYLSGVEGKIPPLRKNFLLI